MNWERIFYDGWQPVARTALIGVCAYVALVLLLRISGKRTLSKFNAFDFVVTIALGSTLASILTSRDVSLAQGATGLALLLGLQFTITWLSVRSPRVRDLVKGEPRLLVLRGEYLDGALRRERVTREEVEAALRQQGLDAVADAEAAVLETDGTITIVERGAREDGRTPSALAGLAEYPTDESR